MTPKDSQGNELVMVSADSYVMRLPEITLDEYRAAAKPYYDQARQVSLKLQAELSVGEKLIEEADHELVAQNLSGVRILLTNAVGQLQQADSPENLTGFVRALRVACLANDKELCSNIIDVGAERLRTVGLDDEAALMEGFPRIIEQLDPKESEIYSIGLMQRVNDSLVGGD